MEEKPTIEASPNGTYFSNGNSNNKRKDAKIETILEKLEIAKGNGKSNRNNDRMASHGSVSVGNNSNSCGTQCGSHNGSKSHSEHSGKFHCGQCWYAPNRGNSSATDAPENQKRHNLKLVKINGFPWNPTTKKKWLNQRLGNKRKILFQKVSANMENSQ